MTGDEAPRKATEGQYEAARRFFRRHPRPADRWAKYEAFDAEERLQESRYIDRGGNT